MANHLAHNGLDHSEEILRAEAAETHAPSSQTAAEKPVDAHASEEAHGAGEAHAEGAHGGVHISLAAERLFTIGSFPVTNSVLMALLSFIVLSAAALSLRKKVFMIPGKLQSIAEMLLEGVFSVMDGVLGSRAKSEKYLPLIATIFLFVVTSNWLGLLPGVGSIFFDTPEGTFPLFRSAAADLNFTLVLGLITIIGVNLFGVLALGFKAHASKFFNLKGIDSFVGLLEFVAEFAKIISFSFRLFGNVFAGEVLLTIVAFLAPYFIPLPFLFLEVFVGFIQGFVFAMLATVFVAIATTGHGEHETEHAH